MNNFEIIIHPSAVSDIDDIASWYFVKSPQAELQFQHKLDAAISKLSKNPLAFGPIKKYSTIRRCMVEKYPYKIFFRIEDNIVEILAIIHTSRSEGYILRRLK